MDGRMRAVGDQRLSVAFGHLAHGEVRLVRVRVRARARARARARVRVRVQG